MMWIWFVVVLAVGMYVCAYGTLRLALGDHWDLALDRGPFTYHSLAFDRDSAWQRIAYHVFLPLGCVDEGIPRSSGSMAYTLHPNPSDYGSVIPPSPYP